MNAQGKSELRITAFFDGRPGHEKQTMGIIRALESLVPVRLSRIEVDKTSRPAKLLQTCRLLLPWRPVAPRQSAPPDLLIGTGSNTHLPLLLYKKAWARPTVTCMTPAWPLRRHFDLCFVPEHDGVARAENIVATIGAPNCCRDQHQHDPNRGLILLGGIDTKSHIWDNRSIAGMVATIIGEDSSVTWTISSSPRTPAETLDLIAPMADDQGRVRFFDYRDTPSGWVEEQYCRNGIVWVSADSISMIYEALSAGCRVGILPVRWLREKGKFKRNEDFLLNRRLVTSFAAWQQEKIFPVAAPPLNEAARCAEEILKRWWPDLAGCR